MGLKILPYKIGSESARALAHALGVKRIIPDGGYVPSRRTTVLNWGNSQPHWDTAYTKILNKPSAVRLAANKLSTLTTLKQAGVPVPEFTTEASVAQQWVSQDYRVIVRHKLNAHSGEGIQVVRPGETVPYGAPLYTKYTRKDQEFRVHVFGGRVIDYSEKRKRNGGLAIGTSNENLIRNHGNGWVFCRDGVYCQDFVKDVAVRAVAALGLDFGALDIIVRGDKCWVLEVNTAPGVEGTTLNRYVEALRSYVNRDFGGDRYVQNRYVRNWG